jgi:hypothetical protein
VCVCVCVCVWERERERERESYQPLLPTSRDSDKLGQTMPCYPHRCHFCKPEMMDFFSLGICVVLICLSMRPGARGKNLRNSLTVFSLEFWYYIHFADFVQVLWFDLQMPFSSVEGRCYFCFLFFLLDLNDCSKEKRKTPALVLYWKRSYPFFINMTINLSWNMWLGNFQE